MTPSTISTRRSPSTLAREYESEEELYKLSTQLQACMMVGSLFCYCFATSLILLTAFAVVPFLPILGRAYSAVLGLLTPANCESGYHFVAAGAARHLSSFLSVLTPSIGSSVGSSVGSSIGSSVNSGFLSSMSSYAASQPAPAHVLPMAKSVMSYIYNEPAVAQLQSYRTDCGEFGH